MKTYEDLLKAITVPAGQGTEVRNPATGETIGFAPVHTEGDLNQAIERAEKAQPGWAALTDEERSEALMAAADAVEEAAEPLAQLLAREVGKPLNGPNARFEAGACAAWLRATAATAPPVEIVVDDGQDYAELHYRPVGVVGAITPWNWPMMIAVWQIAPSLKMGNTVVIKPSENTPLSGLAIAAVINQALPEGVLNVVVGDGELGAAITSSPSFGKIMFTGSTATGRKIIQTSAANLTRLTMELGGNDAGIVLPDVNAEAIAQDLFWGAFINTGQTCAALKRLYVHESVYDDVVAALTQVASSTPMGAGMSEENLLGPLQNQKQWEIVNRLVEQAKQEGARVVVGGDPNSNEDGFFYPATLVADVAPDSALVMTEQFGPALPIVKYSDVEEAIRLANSAKEGLGASVWSSDRETAREVASQLEAGTVWINSHGGVDPRIPFGGTKQSGYGLEFGVDGLKAVSVPQVING